MPSEPEITAAAATDRTRLLKEAYATPDNFAARQSIYRFRQPPHDFIGWVIEHMPAECFDVVVDAGAGNGAYERRLEGRAGRLFAADLSYGMVVSIPPRPGMQRAAADITALPLRSASCTGAFANHMLYHVPDVAAAARELRRVLRPGATLVAATNGREHENGLAELLEGALRRAGADTAWPQRPSHRFCGPDGAGVLRTTFDHVEWTDVRGPLVIPEPQPVVDYVASLRAWLHDAVPCSWDDFLAHLGDECADRIARDGNVTIETHAGVFVCR